MEERLLTPAEAALLAEPGAQAAGKCIRAALLTLLGSGHIAIEGGDGWFGQTKLILADPGPTAPRLADHVLEVRRALQLRGTGKPMTAGQIASVLSQAFGGGYARYVHERVAPGLVRRGLLTRTDDKWLGLFPRIRYARTAKGDALAAPILRLVGRLDDLPKLIKHNPDTALRLAREAGVLLVLSANARAKVPKLRKLLTEHGGDGGFAFAETNDESLQCSVGGEFGDLMLTMDFGDLLDGVDAIGDAGDGGGSDGGDGGGGGD